MLPLALVTGAAMLVAWFPLAALWHQQALLDSTAAQLQAVQRQEGSLVRQEKSVSSVATATLLARQQYQLVAPGQSLIQVLPGAVANGTSQVNGDPGLQPLVAPSSALSLVTESSAPTAAHHSMNGFLARLVRTLEFWR